jgi:hypothetical protein
MEAELVLKDTSHTVAINSERLSAKMEAIFEAGLDAALDILQFGIATDRLRIATSILNVASKAIGADSSTQMREIRLQVDDLFSQMRVQDAAPTRPLTPTTHNPEKELGASTT